MREAIYRALVDRAWAGPFYAVTYADRGRVMTVDRDNTVAPRGVGANETTYDFDESASRRADLMDVQAIGWELRLDFPVEVDLRDFHDAIRQSLHVRDDTGRDIRVIPVRAEITHPPRQDPGNGTQAVYQFTAVPRRS